MLVFAFAPALLGFFIGNRSLVNMRHAGNPAHLIDRVWNSVGREQGIQILIASLAMLTIGLSMRRMGRGIGEVLQASARRTKLARDLRTLESGLSDPEATNAVAES